MSLLSGSSQSVDDRKSISRIELESAITDGMKKYVCEAFAGVIVQHETPKSRIDANWSIRGIKFGGSDREKAAQAVIVIVARMQREFRLSEPA